MPEEKLIKIKDIEDEMNKFASEQEKNKIKEFLTGKNLLYKESSKNETHLFIVLYKTSERFFKIELNLRYNWLYITAKIIDKTDLPKEINLLKLYEKLLMAIHDLPEINYSLDKDGSIYASADMDFDLADYGDFYSEFFGIIFALNHFVNNIATATEPNIEVKGFRADPDVNELIEKMK